MRMLSLIELISLSISLTDILSDRSTVSHVLRHGERDAHVVPGGSSECSKNMFQKYWQV